jgi:hypothetical protein
MQPVGLCGVPFRVLQEQAAQVLATSVQSRTGPDSTEEEEEEETQQQEQEPKQTQLWVDKYKPRSGETY